MPHVNDLHAQDIFKLLDDRSGHRAPPIITRLSVAGRVRVAR